MKSSKKDFLSGKAQINRQYIDKLVDIIKYTNFDLEEDGFIEKNILSISDKALSGDKEAYERLYDYKTYPREADDNGLINNIYERTRLKVCQFEIEKVKSELLNSLSKDDYKYLIDFVYDVDNYRKPEHIRNFASELLFENDFYLPDLSKTLNYDKWSYCHAVAKYAQKEQKLSNKFIDVLKEIVNKHPDSVSAVDKAKALVQYNFKQEIYLEFEQFLKDKNKPNKSQ